MTNPDTPTPSPSAAGAMTEERLAEIRAWLDPNTSDPEPDFEERAVTNVRDLLAALAQRDEEVARLTDELSELRLLKRMLGEPIGDIAKLEARALVAEARLALANEALTNALIDAQNNALSKGAVDPGWCEREAQRIATSTTLPPAGDER